VSKDKPKQTLQRKTVPAASPKASATLAKPGEIAISKPLLWLALAVVVMYFFSFSFGLTELDDSIFIRNFHDYNENLQNLFTSFQRGLFDPTKDPYYRPLFMDSMLLNYHLADHGESLVSYHVINVLLHLLSVILIYKLFLKLNIKELPAFFLSLLFAIHPVLSQAVAWIPGRNDTLLAIFTFSFFLFCIDYSANGKIKSLLLSCLFLLLAFFTKETAVFAAPVAFVLMVLVLQKSVFDKRNLTQYAVWAGCFIVWFLVRSKATVSTGISPAQVAHDFVPRLPLIVQYLGKVFFPFNLSVFPTQQDTVYYYGIAAVVLLAAIIFLTKERNMKAILGGLAIFLLFLLPVLLVPSNLNEQSFEHRLYLPVFGILLLLSQTVLFNNNFSSKNQLYGSIAGIVVVIVFAGINFQHQKSFADPLTFWTEATETSPRSAYANMMLAARLPKEDFNRSCALFRKAYQLNPNEKYLNFYYGTMLQKKDSVKESEKYLLTEKKNSDYYECDFYLARVAMERKDFNGAANYLESYIKRDATNTVANSNLLLLYIDTQQPLKAKAQAKHMQATGMPVPKDLLQKLGL
jgi:protein O-mannosyl-transferase